MSKTLVNIDDGVLKKALKISGLKKKVEIINYALKEFIRIKELKEIKELRGKIKWIGNLNKMRRNRKLCYWLIQAFGSIILGIKIKLY